MPRLAVFFPALRACPAHLSGCLKARCATVTVTPTHRFPSLRAKVLAAGVTELREITAAQQLSPRLVPLCDSALPSGRVLGRQSLSALLAGEHSTVELAKLSFHPERLRAAVEKAKRAQERGDGGDVAARRAAARATMQTGGSFSDSIRRAHACCGRIRTCSIVARSPTQGRGLARAHTHHDRGIVWIVWLSVHCAAPQ